MRIGQELRMYALLSVNRRKWISVLQLQKVSNSMAVSTVISNLRRRYNLTIENKEKYQKNGLIYSFYKLQKGTIKNAQRVVKK